jgi:hypothetical protein
MGFKKWFGKKEEEEQVYRELTLDTMEKGGMVDFDLKTWQVANCSTYDYDGYLSREWELHSGDEVGYLERAEEDGKAEWTFSHRIKINDIDEDIADHIGQHEDPPEEIHYAGQTYTALESSPGIQRVDGEDEEHEFINWSYEGNEGSVLFIVQWGENEFVAYAGTYVEEYQFVDILPAVEEQ